MKHSSSISNVRTSVLKRISNMLNKSDPSLVRNPSVFALRGRLLNAANQFLSDAEKSGEYTYIDKGKNIRQAVNLCNSMPSDDGGRVDIKCIRSLLESFEVALKGEDIGKADYVFHKSQSDPKGLLKNLARESVGSIENILLEGYGLEYDQSKDGTAASFLYDLDVKLIEKDSVRSGARLLLDELNGMSFDGFKVANIAVQNVSNMLMDVNREGLWDLAGYAGTPPDNDEDIENIANLPDDLFERVNRKRYGDHMELNERRDWEKMQDNAESNRRLKNTADEEDVVDIRPSRSMLDKIGRIYKDVNESAGLVVGARSLDIEDEVKSGVISEDVKKYVKANIERLWNDSNFESSHLRLADFVNFLKNDVDAISDFLRNERYSESAYKAYGLIQDLRVFVMKNLVETASVVNDINCEELREHVGSLVVELSCLGLRGRRGSPLKFDNILSAYGKYGSKNRVKFEEELRQHICNPIDVDALKRYAESKTREPDGLIKIANIAALRIADVVSDKEPPVPSSLPNEMTYSSKKMATFSQINQPDRKDLLEYANPNLNYRVDFHRRFDEVKSLGNAITYLVKNYSSDLGLAKSSASKSVAGNAAPAFKTAINSAINLGAMRDAVSVAEERFKKTDKIDPKPKGLVYQDTNQSPDNSDYIAACKFYYTILIDEIKDVMNAVNFTGKQVDDRDYFEKYNIIKYPPAVNAGNNSNAGNPLKPSVQRKPYADAEKMNKLSPRGGAISL